MTIKLLLFTAGFPRLAWLSSWIVLASYHRRAVGEAWFSEGARTRWPLMRSFWLRMAFSKGAIPRYSHCPRASRAEPRRLNNNTITPHNTLFQISLGKLRSLVTVGPLWLASCRRLTDYSQCETTYTYENKTRFRSDFFPILFGIEQRFSTFGTHTIRGTRKVRRRYAKKISFYKKNGMDHYSQKKIIWFVWY